MKRLLLVLILGLSGTNALAQGNPTCPTRPFGDSSNACASTAFVTNRTAGIASIAALKALTAPTFAMTVYVTGYYAAGDGGDGQFTFNPSSVAADNGGTIIAPNSGTGRWIRDVPYGYYSVKWFGAKCDGSNDDSTTINNTDAAAAVANVAVYFPSGTCMAQGLNPVRSNLEWFGDGPYLSIIKAVNPGVGFDTLVWFGPRTATTQILNIYVHDLGFNGNSTGTNAVVEARNVTFSIFRNNRYYSGGAAGFRTDTSTTTINTLSLRNHYMQIETDNNIGKGFYLNGEKDSGVDEIFSHNNTGDGIYFGPANLNSSALCETTQLYGGHLSSRDNGGDGVVFDEAEKFALSSVQTSINGGYGIRFKSTITGCTSTGSNSVSIADLVARNDVLGAFRVADGGYMDGAKFGTIWIRGDNSTVGTTAMELDGVGRVQFGAIEIAGWPGQALLIQQGTPLGVTTQSNQVQFGSVTLVNNGNAGAGTNHGLSVLNTATAIQFGSLIGANLQTSGGNFEVNLSATSSVQMSMAKLTASGGAGNNINVPAGGVLQVSQYNSTLNSGPFLPCLSANTVFNSAQSCTTPQTGTLVQEVASGASMLHEFETYGTGVANQIWGRVASGTSASPGVTANGQFIWQLIGQGYDGNPNWGPALATINMIATEAWAAGKNGSQITIQTTPTGTATHATALTVQASGALSVGTSTDPGIGSLLANKGIGTVPTVVGSLPTCNAGYEGQRAYVTDQATAVAYRGAVTGGGATRQAVLCSNSAWIQD